jgi:hypothetical protein
MLSSSDTAGWAAVGILGGIATLGLTMFTRWIPGSIWSRARSQRFTGNVGRQRVQVRYARGRWWTALHLHRHLPPAG